MQIIKFFNTSYAVHTKTEKAKLLTEHEPASVRVKRERNGLKVNSRPIRLEIENRAFFESMGLKSIQTLANESISKGKTAVMNSTVRNVREGNALVKGSTTVAQIAMSRTRNTIESMLDFMPSEKPQLNWKDGTVEINYKPDELHYRWNVGGVRSRYIPYSVQTTITKLT